MASASGILRAGKYAAAPVLSEPLLPNKESRRTGSLTDEEASAEPDNRVLPESMTTTDMAKTIGVGVLAAAGLAASASAMIAFPGAAVLVMGGVCIVNSPVVAKKHLSIAKGADVRTSVNRIRQEANLLKTEVDFLEAAVNDLEAEKNVLAGVEENLQRIAKDQGTNVNDLVQLVNENEEILSKMKYNLKETFVTSMASIVIRSDTDGDMKISLNELHLLSLRLKVQLDTMGIKLDTDKFEAMVREDNDITSVLKFCGDIFQEENEEKASEDDNSVDSELTFDFEDFCKGLDENAPRRMSTAEKMSMITIDDKYSKGSVEVARTGKRMTLHPGSKKKDFRKESIDKEVKRRQTKLASKRKSLKPVRGTRQTRITLGGLVQIRGTAAEC